MQSSVRGTSCTGLGTLLLCLMASTALAQQPNPLREAYFGETHVHTSWSFDAYIFGNHVTGPEDAYKYAKGETIKHPMGYDIKITTPLDWMGVTDHSEYVGTVRLANEPGSAISKLPIAKELIVHGPADIQRIYLMLGETMITMKPIKALVSPDVAGSIWKENNAIADKANEPGKFTAFCSYEWTSTPNNRNLHRNVFFKDCAKVPELPFSSLESTNPEDLWDWMDGQRKAGNELLAISHNANLSDGHMFPIDVDEKGRPIDAAWAASRDRNERLTEIKQIKGQSETHPLLSPNDEFANYELFNYLLGDPQGQIPTIPGSFVRQAYKDGVAMQQARSYNPYKMGIVAGSDSHDTGVPYRQANFFGAHGLNDGDIKERMAGHVFAGLDVRLENPAGVSGVWAEENTRASLFEAMQRKETFATSGPHIRLRFFGGWDYDKGLTGQQDWVKAGYANGVPMGGDLPEPKAKAPIFVLWAVKDPTSGNLDRIQVIKGWSKSGQSFEKIYDVVWAGDRKPEPFTDKVPPIGSTGGSRQRYLHKRYRRGGAEDRVDRPRLRSEPRCFLLRARAGNPHAALDHAPSQGARHRTAGHRARHGAGTRLELADLVHAQRPGTRGRGARPNRRGAQTEGRRGARRCAAQGFDRRQVTLSAKQCDRRQVQSDLGREWSLPDQECRRENSPAEQYR